MPPLQLLRREHQPQRHERGMKTTTSWKRATRMATVRKRHPPPPLRGNAPPDATVCEEAAGLPDAAGRTTGAGATGRAHPSLRPSPPPPPPKTHAADEAAATTTTTRTAAPRFCPHPST